MNQRQKEVQQAHLDEEKEIVQRLKRIYQQAAQDCEDKIQQLSARKDLANLQAVIYQKQYQEALKRQLEGILDNLNTEEFASIAEYLEKCYENGFFGSLYDLHGQGIPLMFPINQKEVVAALQTDSRLSEGLYSRLGEDTAGLKKSIQTELSRGIANGSSWLDMAAKIAESMKSPYNKALNKAIRIARTEGHRIQNKSAMDCQKKAKAAGADVVKQWDSTLDNRTRPHHKQLDGQIREVEEPFEVAGRKAMAPGYFGVASEDINCRCALLQRTRWALDDEELEELKQRAEFFGLDKAKDFKEFKKKFLDSVENDFGSGIMNALSTKENIQVHYVGKINRDIYKCITEDIVTDEVIITDNQMQHILNRHPEAYKEVIDYLSDIIREPDFIISDKHENTGLVIKKIKTEKEYAQMVLRICTQNDNPNYKNSVISCWEISEKRLQNYLRNKTILYKRE